MNTTAQCEIPRRRQRRSALALSLAASMGVSLGACKIVIQRADDSARGATAQRADSAAAARSGAPQTSVSTGDIADSATSETTPSDLATLASELMVPVPGVKKSELRDTFNEVRDGIRKHEALDIMAPRGTPVLSASAGRVLKLHDSREGGLMVYAADRSNRFVLLYGHLDRYADGLRDSLPLRQGQIIGYVGTTGNAAPDAPHLHFAIAHPRDVTLWWTGTPIDPLPLLQQSASP